MPTQCPPNTFLYTIQRNDNLIRIANRFQVPISAILSANPQINYYSTLYVGDTLCIPNQPVYPTCQQGNYYTIRQGDTLYLIAIINNISLSSLIAANPGIDPNRLHIGQVICLPPVTTLVPCPENTTQYTIKASDTLYSIALRFNIPLSSLINANPRINPNYLFIDQKICIPQATSPLPITKKIPVTVEGQTEYREATLNRSPQDYYIYVLNNFVFTPEEPGKDLLFSTFDDSFYIRIERLPTNADISQIKQNSITELRLLGTPVELTGQQIADPFFRNVNFFLHASTSTLSKNIILMRIGNAQFRFIMNIPNIEASEGITPSFFAMLKTIIPY